MNTEILIDVLRSQYQNILHHEVFQCLISFLVACFVTITSIPLIINITDVLKIKDLPNFRSAHAEEVPKFGGIAIYASILIAHFLWPHTSDQSDAYLTSLSVVGLTILFFLGLKDDIFVLDPNKKLFFQVLAASTLILLGGLKVDNLFGIFGYNHISDYVSIPFTIFIFIALINAVNLIDGIDGLAGGIGFIAGVSFGTWFLMNHHFSMACMAFSLSGSLLGFLRFNFSKTSKIFMGDTGSLLLGFMLAFFAIKFIRLNVDIRHNTDAFFSAPILAVVLLIVPIFDTLRVFLVRILNRKSPFTADRNHLHHVLLDNGMNHFQASATLWILTIASVLGYFLTYKYISNTHASVILAGFFLMYLAAGYLLKIRAVKVKRRVSWESLRQASDRSTQSLAKRIINNL